MHTLILRLIGYKRTVKRQQSQWGFTIQLIPFKYIFFCSVSNQNFLFKWSVFSVTNVVNYHKILFPSKVYTCRRAYPYLHCNKKIGEIWISILFLFFLFYFLFFISIQSSLLVGLDIFYVFSKFFSYIREAYELLFSFEL